MIYVLYSPASRQQIRDMLVAGSKAVKVVVDIRLGILAGGGDLHVDGEAELLAEGCRQEDLWGASWDSVTRRIRYDSMVNLRPQQKNFSPEIQDPAVRARVAEIINDLLGGI